MSEELNDELAKVAKIMRPKFIGFGINDPMFTGSATGVTRRYLIEYQGTGVFSPSAVQVVALANASNGSAFGSDYDTFIWTVFNAQQRPILSNQAVGVQNLNETYDNLDDSKTLLRPNDYLYMDVTSYMAFQRAFVGVILGMEFLL